MREEVHEHAVTDGVIGHVSVSQVSAFDTGQFGGCNRKWYFDKVLRKRTESTDAQSIGTECHRQLETYLKTGQDVLGPIVRAGKRFIPKPDARLGIEIDIRTGGTVLDAAGIPFKGYIDVDNPTGRYLTDEGEERDCGAAVEVLDWKTTVDFKYAKNGPELLRTVQMPGYAEWARRHYRLADTDFVRLSHGYFKTRGYAAAMKTTTTIRVETVREKWEGISQTVAKMKQVATAERIEDVEPTWTACAAYRGCEHRAVCPRSAGVALQILTGRVSKGGAGMSLLKKYAKTAATVTPEVSAAMEVLKEAEAFLASTDLVRLAVGVTPPDAPKSEPPHSAEPVPPEILTTMAPAIQVAAEAWASPVVPLAAPLAEEPPKTRKKRGPRVTVVAVPVEENPHGVMPIECVAVPVEENPHGVMADPGANFAGGSAESPVLTAAISDVSKERSILFDAGPEGISLYADCYVENVDVTDLEPYIRRVCARIEAECGAVDIRASDGKELGFMKWKGVLAACVRAEPPVPGEYVVMDVRESEIRQVVVEALRPLLLKYVRGR